MAKSQEPIINKIYIDSEAWVRMNLYVECCPTEIGGLGLGKKIGSVFHLEEVFILEQNVTEHDTLISYNDLARFLFEFVNGGGDPARIRVWWHSHVNHPLRWSKHDEETIKMLNSDYLISIIGNKSGQWVCRLDIQGPPIKTIQPVPMEVPELPDKDLLPDQNLRKAIEEEIAQKVHVWELVRLPGQSGYFFGTRVVTSDYSYALESYGSFLIPWEGSHGDPNKGGSSKRES
jgi:hypothetical protein